MGNNKNLIIGEISNAISELLGSSAAAVMRRAGMKASNSIWPELPSGKSPQEAAQMMHDAVEKLGGFGNFTMEAKDDGFGEIQFHDCAFAEFSKSSGKPCGEQPICYFGFGLVEETYKRLTGHQAKVVLVKRDEGKGICFETATPK